MEERGMVTPAMRALVDLGDMAEGARLSHATFRPARAPGTMHATDGARGGGNFLRSMRSYLLEPMRAPIRNRSLAAWIALSVAVHGGAIPATLWGSGLHRGAP